MKEKLEKMLTAEVGKEVKLEKPPEDYGDYSSNISFLLAKEKGKSPVEIAEEIKGRIKLEIFSKIEVKGGFLNFFLAEDALKEELSLLLREKDNYGKKRKGKRMLVDYSSPNIAKSFGIGHLRSTIIGQAVYNIYQLLGWKVYGVNHLGDWGTQYGKLLYQIKKENKDPEKLSLKELEDLYVRFHKEAEEDPEMEKKGAEWFLKLEQGEKEARIIWEICKRKSLEEFNEIYKKLDIKIDYTLGESFYEDKLQEVVEEAQKKEVAKKSQGALIVEFEDMPPAMILKSDGSTTYFTRDLAAVKYRVKEFSPDMFVYEVGADQVLHLKQLFRTAEKFGWAKESDFYHMPHGMFRLKEGKFSTRKGRTIHLKEVLSLAEEKAKEMMKESSSFEKLSTKEKKEIPEIIGVGAVKYNDLKKHHKRDVVFDWERMLTLKGDSGPYLQYTCVRCKSLLKKSKNHHREIEGDFNERERKLVRTILEFKEVVDSAANNFSPNIIAEYAYRLAKEFNSFYDSFPILEDEKRVVITEATLVVLKKCLHLLTISVPEKM